MSFEQIWLLALWYTHTFSHTTTRDCKYRLGTLNRSTLAESPGCTLHPQEQHFSHRIWAQASLSSLSPVWGKQACLCSTASCFYSGSCLFFTVQSIKGQQSFLLAMFLFVFRFKQGSQWYIQYFKKSEGKTNFQKTEMLHAIFNLILFMLAFEGQREGGRNHSVKTYSKNKMSHHIEL